MVGPIQMRALLVQNESSPKSLAIDAFRALGAIVESADTGAYALQLVQRGTYDIVIVAGTLGDCDGYDVIRRIRRARVDTRVMMIPDTPHSHDRTLALQIGADDCVSPLAEPRELALRIRALLQRPQGGDAIYLMSGGVQLNPRAMAVFVHGEPVRLTGKEFAVLQLLLERKGRAVSKEDFMLHLYDGSDDPETKIIDVFICKVRRKLAAAGARDIVKTVWGRGYMISSKDSSPRKPPPFFLVPDPTGEAGHA